MAQTDRYDEATADLSGQNRFPEPAAVVSLRYGRALRAVDNDGQPMLIITDGVTTIALDSGLSGLSYGVVVASQRLADAVGDFATSIAAAWEEPREPPTSGKHRRNRRQLAPWRLGRSDSVR